jgi:hypothetical protein
MVARPSLIVTIALLGVSFTALNLSEYLPGVPTVQASRLSQKAALRERALRDRDLLRRYLQELRAGQPFDLDEATRRVYRGTTHSVGRRVNLRENWLQRLLGQFYEPLSRTQDTERLIDGGFADCSERSQILKTIAEEAGCACRFIGLHGHVVLEVCLQGTWRIADADYGVTYPVGLAGLESAAGPLLVRGELAKNGYDAAAIDRYIELVHSVDDNVALPIGSPLSPRLWVLERCCNGLAWALPAACFAMGLVGLAAKPSRRSRYQLLRQV